MLRFDFEGWPSLAFADPVEILRADHPREVPGVLRRAQAAGDDGHFAAGYVTYEAAGGLDPVLATHPPGPGPVAWFGVYPAPITPPEADAGEAPGPQWQWPVDASDYLAAVAAIKRRIAAGQTYQVNYAVPLSGTPVPGDAYARYVQLWRHHRPRYGAFLRTPDLDIVSLSPELFVARNAHTLTTRPMKGTAARGRFPAEDAEYAAGLLGSTKERAENVMIVDLLRNDLSRVCQAGTVAVPALLTVESHPTFHALTSTVTGTLRPRVGLPEVFEAMFPCGSVTGAPKARSMAVIRELEPTARGVYCGAIGVIQPGGDYQFSVAIRTIELSDRARYWVGSGITWPSFAPAEFAELRVKSRVVTQTSPDFSLLETMLWTGEHIADLALHLDRLRFSAERLGFAFNARLIRSQIEAVLADDRGRQRRVRLTVAPSGAPQVTSSAVPNPGQVRAALTDLPIDSTDDLWFHKTTDRTRFEERLATAGEVDDVILVNERGELTEFTIGSLVVELGGQLLTPPVGCGLLPGITRHRAIESGTVNECRVLAADLYRADRIWRLNSVRGWEPVMLADSPTSREACSGPGRRSRG
ncbi:MAG: chorismate-binding protein [Arachnia sp.]